MITMPSHRRSRAAPREEREPRARGKTAAATAIGGEARSPLRRRDRTRRVAAPGGQQAPLLPSRAVLLSLLVLLLLSVTGSAFDGTDRSLRTDNVFDHGKDGVDDDDDVALDGGRKGLGGVGGGLTAVGKN